MLAAADKVFFAGSYSQKCLERLKFLWYEEGGGKAILMAADPEKLVIKAC